MKFFEKQKVESIVVWWKGLKMSYKKGGGGNARRIIINGPHEHKNKIIT